MDPIVKLLNSLDQLADKAKALSTDDIDRTVACVRQKTSSVAASSLGSALRDTKQLVDTSANIAKIKQKLEDATNYMSSLVDAVDAVAKGSSSSYGFVSMLVQNGGKIQDILAQLTKLQQLDDMYRTMLGAGDSLSGLQSQVGTIMDNFKSIASNGADLSSCASDNMLGAVAALTELFSGLENLRIRQPVITAGIQTYNRWSDVSFDVPCTRTGSRCFSLAGQKQCVDYPEVYGCRYETEVPFPNHHIPYVRVRFV